MIVSLQLLAIEVVFNDKLGEIGGDEVALTVIVFEFVAPPGFVKVRVTV